MATLGVSVAIVNPAASQNNVFVRLQIKENENNDLDQLNKDAKAVTSGSDKQKIKALTDSTLPQHDTGSIKSVFNDQVKPYDTKSSVTPKTVPRSHHSILGRTRPYSYSFRESAITGQSVHGIQSALEKSESHRTMLMNKLDEAQTTLELQNERLNRAESVAKDNGMLVEDLKFKEREYRKTVNLLDVSEKGRQLLQLENLRIREEMRDRVRTLENELRTLRAQYENMEKMHNRQNTFLDQTATTMTLMEEKDAKLQHDKEKLLSEVMMLKENLNLSRARFDALEEDKRNFKNESMRLKEDNIALSQKIQDMAEQILELSSLLKTIREENERLSSKWKASAEDQSQAARLSEEYQRTICDLKSQLLSANAENSQLVLEKQEMNRKIKRNELDKEQLMKKIAQNNVSLQEETAIQKSKMESWKNTCEQLTASVTHKEGELWSLTGKCHQMEDTISGLRQEILALKDENKVLCDRNKTVERYSSEEKSSLKQVLETLKQQLESAKENQLSQDKIIKSLKEVSGRLLVELILYDINIILMKYLTLTSKSKPFLIS